MKKFTTITFLFVSMLFVASMAKGDVVTFNFVAAESGTQSRFDAGNNLLDYLYAEVNFTETQAIFDIKVDKDYNPGAKAPKFDYLYIWGTDGLFADLNPKNTPSEFKGVESVADFYFSGGKERMTDGGDYSFFNFTLNFAEGFGEADFFSYLNSEDCDFMMGLHLMSLTEGESVKVYSVYLTPGDVTPSGGSATPEPATMLVMGLGLLGAGFYARRRMNR